MLRGTVAHRGANFLVIDVNGVGYKVSAPEPMITSAKDELTVHISTVVREDAFLLYGFLTIDERDVFDILRDVNGIGPKQAMAVLSHLSLEQLEQSVTNDDLAGLIKVPGVGKKTASRMCLELKNKLKPTFTASGSKPVSTHKTNDPIPLALAQLDYKKSEIDVVLGADTVPKLGEAALEVRLGAALKVLARHL